MYIEMMVRILIEIPDDFENVQDLIIDIDSIDNIDVLDFDSVPINSKVIEYETMMVEQVEPSK